MAILHLSVLAVSSSPVFKTASPDSNTSDWLHVASSRMKATNSRLVWDSSYVDIPQIFEEG